MDIGVGYGAQRPRLGRQLARARNRTKLGAALLLLCVLWLLFGRKKPVAQEPAQEPNDVQSLIQEREIRRENIRYLNFGRPFVNPATLALINYDNGGNMVMKKDSDYVRLVSERPNSVGYVFSRLPVSLQDADSFEAIVDFKIHGQQTRISLIGDGMAFWLTSQPLSQGDMFGMQNDYHGLAVIVDTFKNTPGKMRGNRGANSFPRVSIQSNNGFAGKYNKDDDGTTTELGSCALHRAYNTPVDVPSRMRVRYIRSSGYFSVEFDLLGNDNWKTCFSTTDLAASLVPETPYVGVSAETGELFHNVDLYGIEVNSLKDASGRPVQSIDALIDRLDDKIDAETKQHEAKRRHRRFNKPKKNARRRSASRLRRAEQRAKQLNKELYNDERGAIGYFFNLLWRLFKYALYTAMFVILAYIGLLGYRVYRDKRKRRNQRGLL
ncbi:hypothetical protein KL947_004191 [Ogataea haglerorum]|nr:hypothetical protein KL947_004191 [Ogataea haglerorum]